MLRVCLHGLHMHSGNQLAALYFSVSNGIKGHRGTQPLQAHLAAQLSAFADAARVVAQQRAAAARLIAHRRARLDLRNAATTA